MDKPEDAAALLAEIRDLLRQGATQQAEVIEFLRADAESRRAVIARSVALQEESVRRQKAMQWMVVPIVVVCLGVLAFLLYQY